MSEPEGTSLANILSGSSLLAVIAGLLKGGTKYGELSRSQQDIEKRVERCEATHSVATQKLDAVVQATAKMGGAFEQISERLGNIESRLDRVLEKH